MTTGSGNLQDIGRDSARSSFFLFAGQSFSTLIMAVTAITVGRLLGPEKYGLYTLALTVPTLLQIVTDLGISSALVVFIARLRSDHEEEKAVNAARIGVIFKIAVAASTSLFVFLLSEQIASLIMGRPDAAFFLAVATLFLLGHAVLQTINSVYVGFDRSDMTGLLMGLQAISKAMISLMLVAAGLEIVGALLGAGLGALTASAAGILLMRKVLPRVSHTFREGPTLSDRLGPMLRYGFPVYLSALLAGIMPQYQSLVLARFVTDAEIGNYSTTINFSSIALLVTAPVATALLPAFSKLSVRESKESVEKMFKLSVKYTSLMVVPVAIALVLFSKEVMYALYGSSFGLAPGYLSLYALNFLNAVLGSLVLGNFFNGQGDTKAALKVGAVTFLLSLFLAPALVSLFRVPGLMVSISVVGLASSLFSLLLSRRMYGISIEFSSSFKILLSSIIAAFPIIIFNWLIPISDNIVRLVIGGFTYLALYLFVAPAIGAVTEEDISNLHAMTDCIPAIRPLASRVLRLETGVISFVKR